MKYNDYHRAFALYYTMIFHHVRAKKYKIDIIEADLVLTFDLKLRGKQISILRFLCCVNRISFKHKRHVNKLTEDSSLRQMTAGH